MILPPFPRQAVLRLALTVALAGPALAGCASPQAEQAAIARTALVGMPRETLLSCAGVPPRARNEGNVEYFTYGSGQIRGSGGPSFGIGLGTFGGSGGGFGYGLGIDTTVARDISSDYCEATFTIVDGRVEQVNYSAFSGVGAARYAQCYTIVANCLAVARRPAPAGLGG